MTPLGIGSISWKSIAMLGWINNFPLQHPRSGNGCVKILQSPQNHTHTHTSERITLQNVNNNATRPAQGTPS